MYLINGGAMNLGLGFSYITKHTHAPFFDRRTKSAALNYLAYVLKVPVDMVMRLVVVPFMIVAVIVALFMNAMAFMGMGMSMFMSMAMGMSMFMSVAMGVVMFMLLFGRRSPVVLMVVGVVVGVTVSMLALVHTTV
jgi:hypothetical protein